MTSWRQPAAGSRPASVIVGGRGEQAAAEYLERLGYQVIERNYRRKHCEIDLVVQKAGLVLCVEVKYRATDHFGAGLDYIAGDKLRRMRRAAETWVAEHRWHGEYDLAAIEVSGVDYQVTAYIESVL